MRELNHKCRHRKNKSIGIDPYHQNPRNGDIILYWCQQCGAIGRKYVGEKHLKWEKPTKF